MLTIIIIFVHCLLILSSWNLFIINDNIFFERKKIILKNISKITSTKTIDSELNHINNNKNTSFLINKIKFLKKIYVTNFNTKRIILFINKYIFFDEKFFTIKKKLFFVSRFSSYCKSHRIRPIYIASAFVGYFLPGVTGNQIYRTRRENFLTIYFL